VWVILSTLKKVWLYANKYKWLLILGIIFTILNVITSMIPGEIIKRIVDDVIKGGNIDYLPPLLIALSIVAVLRSGSIFMRDIFWQAFHKEFL